MKNQERRKKKELTIQKIKYSRKSKKKNEMGMNIERKLHTPVDVDVVCLEKIAPLNAQWVQAYETNNKN
jgi:hypothetical protein